MDRLGQPGELALSMESNNTPDGIKDLPKQKEKHKKADDEFPLRNRLTGS
jgi:hypothetical protein